MWSLKFDCLQLFSWIRFWTSSVQASCEVIVFLITFITVMQMNVEKLMKMAGAVRTGGKGSVRRCVEASPMWKYLLWKWHKLAIKFVALLHYDLIIYIVVSFL